MQKQSVKKSRLEEPPQNAPATNPFLRCAHLILPWLTPQELAAISLTCKTLTLISKSVALSRSRDASRSLEIFAVPFYNAVDEQLYAYFFYTPCQILASSSPTLRQLWGSAPDPVSDSLSRFGSFFARDSDRDSVKRVSPDVESEPNLENGSGSAGEPSGDRMRQVDESGELAFGCGCKRCNEVYCPCLATKGLEISYECGLGCGCGTDCPNRVTQKGISVRLKIVRVEKKGWGLFANQFIKQGQFICEYAGELLTTMEAQKRQKNYDKLLMSSSSALLVIREHLPSGKACLRINIDATRTGNIARFINHSCDGGNLSSVLLRSSGTFLPRLCFFASRDILQDEELTFSYGDFRVRDNGLKCFCGSSCCFGTLPSENT